MSEFDEKNPLSTTDSDANQEAAAPVDSFDDFEKPVVSEISLPPVNKKKKNLLKLIIPAAVLVVAAVVGLVIYVRAETTPYKKVKKAFEKTIAFDNPYEELLGYEELMKKQAEKKPSSKGLELSLQQLYLEDEEFDTSKLEGLGFTLDSSIDYDKKLAAALIGIVYGDTKYISANTKIEGDKISFEIPELLDAAFVIDFSTFGRDLRSSKLLEEAGSAADFPIPYELSIDVWNFLRQDFLKELKESLKKHTDVFIDGFKIEKINKDAVTLPEDITAKKVYKITVSKDSIKTLAEESLSTIMTFVKDTMKEKGILEKDVELPTDGELEDMAKQISDALGDLVFTLTTGKKGTITYIEVPLNIEDEKITCALRFKDSAFPLEEASLTLTDPERNAFSASLKCSKDGTAAYRYDLKFVIDTDKEGKTFNLSHRINKRSGEFILSGSSYNEDVAEMTFKIEGAFDDIVKGKKFTTTIDTVNFTIPDEVEVTLAGKAYLDTTKANLTFESGKEYYILAMDETDLMLISAEASKNIQENELFKELMEELQ